MPHVVPVRLRAFLLFNSEKFPEAAIVAAVDATTSCTLITAVYIKLRNAIKYISIDWNHLK